MIIRVPNLGLASKTLNEVPDKIVFTSSGDRELAKSISFDGTLKAIASLTNPPTTYKGAYFSNILLYLSDYRLCTSEKQDVERNC